MVASAVARLLWRLQFCFDRLAHGYGWLTARVVRLRPVVLLVYAGVIGFGLNEFPQPPIGFVPQVDVGYLKTSPSFPAARP